MQFRFSMDRSPETRKRWGAVGTFVFWVVVYFWAVWLFDQLLPPVPEQTPLEVLIQGQVGNRREGGDAPEEQQLEDATLPEQRATEASDN